MNLGFESGFSLFKQKSFSGFPLSQVCGYFLTCKIFSQLALSSLTVNLSLFTTQPHPTWCWCGLGQHTEDSGICYTVFQQHCFFNLCRYEVNLQDALKEGLKKATVGGVTGGVFWLLIFSIFALAFWYGAKLTRDDCMDPGAILQVNRSLLRKFHTSKIIGMPVLHFNYTLQRRCPMSGSIHHIVCIYAGWNNVGWTHYTNSNWAGAGASPLINLLSIYFTKCKYW